MPFMQTLEIHTSKFDEMQALDEKWRTATEGKRTLRRSILCRDRNDPNHYLVLAFFDSPESAAINSDLPETAAFASGTSALADSSIAFHDFDVVDDQS